MSHELESAVCRQPALLQVQDYFLAVLELYRVLLLKKLSQNFFKANLNRFVLKKFYNHVFFFKGSTL